MRKNFATLLLAAAAILPAAGAFSSQSYRAIGGEHGDHSRIVLPVPTDIRVDVRQSKGEILFRIDGSVDVDLEHIARVRAAHRVLRATAEQVDGATLVRLGFDCDCSVDVARRPERLVINIRDGASPAAAVPVAAAPQPASVRPEPRSSQATSSRTPPPAEQEFERTLQRRIGAAVQAGALEPTDPSRPVPVPAAPPSRPPAEASRPASIATSPPTPVDPCAVDPSLNRLVDLNSWIKETPVFSDAIAQFRVRSARSADERELADIAVEMARMYLSRGMIHEALSSVEWATRLPVAPDQALEVRAIRDVAMILRGRHFQTSRLFAEPPSCRFADAPFWRAVIATAGRSGTKADYDRLVAERPAFEFLPEQIRADLVVMAAETALDGGFPDAAEKLLDVILFLDIPANDDANRRFLTGRLHAARGQMPDAIREWRIAAQRPWVKGGLGALAALVDASALDRDGYRWAVTNLEGRDYEFRGDPFEGRVVLARAKALAGLGAYQAALNDIAAFIQRYPGGTREAEARVVARSILLSLAADPNIGILGLALFAEREGLLGGDREDHVARLGVAEQFKTRLLFDSASKLLEKVIGGAAGVTRARAGFVMAEIENLRGRNKEAMSVLDQTELDAPTSSPERVALRISILQAMGETANAAYMANASGGDTIEKRAALLWASAQWAAAAQDYRLIADGHLRRGEAREAGFAVFRWAAASYMDGRIITPSRAHVAAAEASGLGEALTAILRERKENPTLNDVFALVARSRMSKAVTDALIGDSQMAGP